MAVWVGMLGLMLSLDTFGGENLNLPVAGGYNLLEGQSCTNKTGHCNFEVRECRRSRFIVLVSRGEAISLLVHRALHTYMNHPMNEKKNLWKLLQTAEVKIAQFVVLVGHGDF